MKTKYGILVLALFVNISLFAQKEELKALKKIYSKEKIEGKDLLDYKANITKLEGLPTEENDKVYSRFYKSMLPILEALALGPNATPIQMLQFVSPAIITDLAQTLSATLDYEKKSGKKIYTDDINETITNYKPIFWDYVVALDKQQKYDQVWQAIYGVYLMDKKDQERLYDAANYAFRAKNYDKALEFFNELNALNYTGEETFYVAKSKANDALDRFSTAVERDKMVALGSHSSPSIEKVPSKRGEIWKTIVFIYTDKNDIAGAKKAIVEARKANPEDVSLIVAESNLYYQTKDFDTYKRLISEALAKNPNNADLYYNLGVITADSKEKGAKGEAESYYLKAIEIDPKYKDAYVNLAVLKLDAEKSIVDQMNAIKGTSPAENKKYEELKKIRINIFKSTLPYLEKAYELFATDQGIKSTLMSVYNALDMTEKYKALKAK